MTLTSGLVITVVCGLVLFTVGLVDTLFSSDEDRVSLTTLAGLVIYGGGLLFTAAIAVAYVGLGL